MYYQSLEHLLYGLRVRLVKNEDRFLALIPINLNKLKKEDELHIYDTYRAYLQTQEELTLEIKKWKARWELYPTNHVRPKAIFVRYWNLYPNIYCFLKILLTMPPSTVT